MVEGVATLGDEDLIALLVADGTRRARLVAASAVEAHGGIEGMARASPHRLASVRGVGATKAARIAAAFELGRRTAVRATTPRLCTSGAVAAWFSVRLGSLAHEEMWVVALDGQNGLRATRRVSIGGLHGCAVAARDVVRQALLLAGSSFVLVHNHPSGDPAPSAEDAVMTRAVAAAAQIVGVPLVDHVIVTPTAKYASFLELGLLAER
jgi:DNA repair protein RadC